MTMNPMQCQLDLSWRTRPMADRAGHMSMLLRGISSRLKAIESPYAQEAAGMVLMLSSLHHQNTMDEDLVKTRIREAVRFSEYVNAHILWDSVVESDILPIMREYCPDTGDKWPVDYWSPGQWRF